MGASGTDNFCLRWNDFSENVSGSFKELRAESALFDVTLACSDSESHIRTLPAHKVILSACSSFFKSTFRQQNHPNPYIYLRGVPYHDMAFILDFIYNGEVNVAQEDLNAFLSIGEELKIKGLIQDYESKPASGPPGKRGRGRPRKSEQAGYDQLPPVKKIRHSSPIPAPINMVEPILAAPTTPTDSGTEVKEERMDTMIRENFKKEPEEAIATTSAGGGGGMNLQHDSGEMNIVHPSEPSDDQHYDESYDGHFEDHGEGTEMGNDCGERVGGDVPKDDMWSWAFDGSDMARCHLCNVQIKATGTKAKRTKEKIYRHLREVHSIGLTIYTCQHCSKTFKRKYKYKEHMCPLMYEQHHGLNQV